MRVFVCHRGAKTRDPIVRQALVKQRYSLRSNQREAGKRAIFGASKRWEAQTLFIQKGFTKELVPRPVLKGGKDSVRIVPPRTGLCLGALGIHQIGKRKGSHRGMLIALVKIVVFPKIPDHDVSGEGASL